MAYSETGLTGTPTAADAVDVSYSSTSFTVGMLVNVSWAGGSRSMMEVVADASSVLSLSGGTGDDIDMGATSFDLTYPLQVDSISNSYGNYAGGESVTLTGKYFLSGAAVYFGGEAATDVVVVDDETIICNTPAHSAALVDISVVNTDGLAGNDLVGAYEYESLAITSISPSTIPFLGGSSISIYGTGFHPDVGVTILGGTTSSGFTVTWIDSHQIDVDGVDPHLLPYGYNPGPVQIYTQNPDLTYVGDDSLISVAPEVEISAASPSSGAIDEYTTLTLTVTNANWLGAVKFGGFDAVYAAADPGDITKAYAVPPVWPVFDTLSSVDIDVINYGGSTTNTLSAGYTPLEPGYHDNGYPIGGIDNYAAFGTYIPGGAPTITHAAIIYDGDVGSLVSFGSSPSGTIGDDTVELISSYALTRAMVNSGLLSVRLKCTNSWGGVGYIYIDVPQSGWQVNGVSYPSNTVNAGALVVGATLHFKAKYVDGMLYIQNAYLNIVTQEPVVTSSIPYPTSLYNPENTRDPVIDLAGTSSSNNGWETSYVFRDDIAITDNAKFEIVDNKIQFRSDCLPDYESPADYNTGNQYIVLICATDGYVNSDLVYLWIFVTNQEDEPAPRRRVAHGLLSPVEE